MVLLFVCHSTFHDLFSIPLHRSSDRPTLPHLQKKNHMQSPSTDTSAGSGESRKVRSCSFCSRSFWGHDMDKLKQRKQEGPLDRFQTDLVAAREEELSGQDFPQTLSLPFSSSRHHHHPRPMSYTQSQKTQIYHGQQHQ